MKDEDVAFQMRDVGFKTNLKSTRGLISGDGRDGKKVPWKLDV